MSNPPSILIVTILAAVLALLVWVGVGRAGEGGRKEQIAGISKRMGDIEKWFCPEEYAGGMWWNEGTLGKSRPDLEEAVEELHERYKLLLDYLGLQEKTIPAEPKKKILERKDDSFVIGNNIGSAEVDEEEELYDSVTLTAAGTLEVVRRMEREEYVNVFTPSGQGRDLKKTISYFKDIYRCGPNGIRLDKTIEGKVIPARTIPEAVEWPEQKKGGE